jgi:hypothetical protein
MSKTEKPLNVNIDIKSSQPITSPEGNHIFAEGVILRKVSKFVAGTAEDAIIPIPVMYDVKTGKVLVELLPKDIRDEYANI